MKFGVSLAAVNPTIWPDITAEADRLGYESVWLPEHLVIPVGMDGSPHEGQEHPPIPADIPVFDAFVYLGFLAGRTRQIRFSTYVYNIGLRHPFVTARAVATLDVVSSGRAMCAVGASWLEEEWRAVGLDFSTRGRRVDEAIEVCRRLWTEPVVEHHGEFFDFAPVMFEPKPVQAPHPPIVIGGDGPAALRRAAHHGAWVPMNHGPEQIPAAVARIAELRARAGLPGRVEVTLGADVRRAGDVAEYEQLGVDRLVVRPWSRTRDAIDGLRAFAQELAIPAPRDPSPTAPGE